MGVGCVVSAERMAAVWFWESREKYQSFLHIYSNKKIDLNTRW